MFEDLKANISLLEGRAVITEEDILDSMCKLYDDAAPKMVERTEDYGDSLVNLYDRISPAYKREAERLKQLNDRDINDIMESSKAIEAELLVLRPILEQLIAEKKRYDVLKEEYQQSMKRQEELKKELEKLKDISPEELKEEEQRLKNEVQRRNENQQLLSSINGEIEKLQEETASLKEQQAEQEQQRQMAEEDIRQMKKAASDYEAWKLKFDEQKAELEISSAEAVNSYMLIKNAWESLKLREDLPELLENVEEFRSLHADIESYADLEQWFDHTGAGLRKVLELYSEMYKKLLEAVNKTTR